MVVVVAVEAAASGHLAPVCEDGGARLERAELVAFVREHPAGRRKTAARPPRRAARTSAPSTTAAAAASRAADGRRAAAGGGDPRTRCGRRGGSARRTRRRCAGARARSARLTYGTWPAARRSAAASPARAARRAKTRRPGCWSFAPSRRSRRRRGLLDRRQRRRRVVVGRSASLRRFDAPGLAAIWCSSPNSPTGAPAHRVSRWCTTIEPSPSVDARWRPPPSTVTPASAPGAPPDDRLERAQQQASVGSTMRSAPSAQTSASVWRRAPDFSSTTSSAPPAPPAGRKVSDETAPAAGGSRTMRRISCLTSDQTASQPPSPAPTSSDPSEETVMVLRRTASRFTW